MKIAYSPKFSLIAINFIVATAIAFLSEWIQKTEIIVFPLGFRHIIIVIFFAINWGFYRNRLFLPRNYKLALISIFLFLLIGWFFKPSQLLNYILGIWFAFLFVIMFILGASTKSKRKTILQIFNSLLVFFLLVSIFPISEGLIGDVELRWIPTLFREMGAYSAAMNIGTIIGISMYIITSKKRYLYIAGYFSFGILLTILKKTIVSNIIVWIAFFIFHGSSKIKMKLIWFFMLFIATGYYIVGDMLIDNINENAQYLEDVGSSGHVRIGMYLASIKIATDSFPFGSGMGTFGSLASIIGGYSQTYFDYGVSNIGSNSPADVDAGHHTLLDTYWPHIIGELGIIGTVLFLYIWIFPTRLSFSLLKSSTDLYIKGLSFYITLIIITISWEGLTLYTPEIPSFIILHSGLSGLCYFHISRNTTS
jgi:hypothetical protein